MRITETAAKIILQTMVSQGLDPKKISILFDICENRLTFEFTLEDKKRETNFYGLRVQHSNQIPKNLIIDYAEVQGKRGLVFTNNEGK